MVQKETEITALQQKLVVMEDTVSQLQNAFTMNNMEQVNSSLLHHSEQMSRTDKSPENSFNSNTEDMIHKLRTALDDERQNSKRVLDHADGLQKMLDNLECEKDEMKAQLTAVQSELERAEAQAREVQQYKAEKEELNQDVARLDGLVQQLQNMLREEEEAREHLRSKHEAEIGNYELRLQTLEEERGMNVAQLTEAHEAAIRCLREEHLEEVGHIQELLERAHHNHLLPQHGVSEELVTGLNWAKASKEQHNEKTIGDGAAKTVPSLNASVTEEQNDMMERYLAMAVQHESSWAEQSLVEHSLLENSEASKFELESELFESRFSDHHNTADGSDRALSVQPSQAEDEPPDVGGMSFTEGQWENTSPSSNGLNESVEQMDLGKELLIQQCSDLTAQLEEKERQLEILQEEVRCSAEELEEARERWSKASEELEEAKWELETEREKRLQVEEIISQKTHEQDNLKNKLSALQSHQEREQLTPGVSNSSDMNSILSSREELLKEMKEEKLKLVLQLKQQEQLVRDIQEQKMAGDSVSSEVQALFGRQLSSLQAQRDQLMAQLENLREKNQATSVLLGQKSLEVDSANREIQQLRAEVEEKVENLQNLEKVKSDLEAKLMCLKQNLTNMEEALSQGAAEKAILEKRLQALEEQTQRMEKTLEFELENFEVWNYF